MTAGIGCIYLTASFYENYEIALAHPKDLFDSLPILGLFILSISPYCEKLTTKSHCLVEA